jgi:hypothetical protein
MFFLQIIELVESLYYSHDNSTRHFYWNKLQVEGRYQNCTKSISESNRNMLGLGTGTWYRII